MDRYLGLVAVTVNTWSNILERGQRQMDKRRKTDKVMHATKHFILLLCDSEMGEVMGPMIWNFSRYADRTPLINAQCRSMSIKIHELISNTSKCRSILLN